MSPRRSNQTLLLRTSSKTSENLEVSSPCSHFPRHGSISRVGPRPRSDEHASAPTERSLQSQEEGSISSSSFRTRAQLLRPRLRSPARRRNSSAEWPGPSNSPAILAHPLALQTAANATAASLKPSAQAAAHREINLDSSPSTRNHAAKPRLQASSPNNQRSSLLSAASYGLAQGLRTSAC